MIDVILIFCIILVIGGASAATFFILQKGAPSTVRDENASNTNSIGSVAAKLDGVTGKYNGGLEKLALDQADVPKKLGTFVDYGEPDGYQIVDNELAATGVKQEYSRFLQTGDETIQIFQTFGLYTSMEKAATRYQESKQSEIESGFEIKTYATVKPEHFYTGMPSDSSQASFVRAHILDSNLYALITMYYPSTVDAAEFQSVVEFVANQLEQYQALNASELAEESEHFGQFERDRVRISILKTFQSGLAESLASPNPTNQARLDGEGTLEINPDGIETWSGSLKSLRDSSTTFNNEMNSRGITLLAKGLQLKITYRPTANGYKNVLTSPMETGGWYAFFDKTETNTIGEELFETEPK